jgi:hypothetical protein
MPHPYEAERETLEDDTHTTLLEGRTILPGAQTLFGFQLSALFTAAFREQLSTTDRYVHFASLALNAAAIAVLMFPAAYHRQVIPGVVSRNFVAMVGRTMTVALAFVGASLSSTMFLVCDLVFDSRVAAAVGAGVASTTFVVLWFVWPRFARRNRTRQELQAERSSAHD